MGEEKTYDLDHEGYQKKLYQEFINLRITEFINTYRFEGDKEFTPDKQRIFLKMVFKYGYAGILNTNKLVDQKIKPKNLEIARILGIPKNEIAKKIYKDDKIPLYIAPNLWDVSENVIRGIGNTSERYTLNKQSFNCNFKNTAFIKFSHADTNGLDFWGTSAYISSTTDLLIKKRLLLTDAKLVQNKVNNAMPNGNYENIYNSRTAFLDISPQQGSVTGNKGNLITVGSVLDQKIKKLDMSSGETLGDLIEFAEKNEKLFFKRRGKRVGENEEGGERSITQDYESVESNYQIFEEEFKFQIKKFIENYKEVFGIQLTFVSKIDEVREELARREVEKAGHLEKAKSKGDKKDEN